MDGNDIHRTGYATLGSSAQIAIPAHGLNEHPLYRKTCLLQQNAVIVELNRPIHHEAHTVITQNLLGLGLLLRLGCFIRTEFKFQIENQPGHFNEPLLLFIGERDIGIVLGFKECFLLLPKRLQLLLELLFVLR